MVSCREMQHFYLKSVPPPPPSPAPPPNPPWVCGAACCPIPCIRQWWGPRCASPAHTWVGDKTTALSRTLSSRITSLYAPLHRYARIWVLCKKLQLFCIIIMRVCVSVCCIHTACPCNYTCMRTYTYSCVHVCAHVRARTYLRRRASVRAYVVYVIYGL